MRLRCFDHGTLLVKLFLIILYFTESLSNILLIPANEIQCTFKYSTYFS
jgi:hypothetical protein